MFTPKVGLFVVLMLATILNVTIAMQFLLITSFKYFRGAYANFKRDAKISKSLTLALLIN